MMGEASFRAPFAFLADRGGRGALAVLTETQGPAYRSAGSVMAIGEDGSRVGSLSSGCIEADIALQAAQARTDGRARVLRYGAGSPFADLRLPCGGAMTVLVVPDPDPAPLRAVLVRTAARRLATLTIDPESGRMSCMDPAPAPGLHVTCPPETRVLVPGAGAEARFFAALAHAAGYIVEVFTPEEETLRAASALGVSAKGLSTLDAWAPGPLDPWTAVVLFFHDHDREPALLAAALASHAFYVGAQGSRKAHDDRLATMRAAGVAETDLRRLRSPIGVTPSTRDPRALAISVLADISAAAPATQTILGAGGAVAADPA
jgi:xanthine dehydrogenase accessory factor